MTYQFPEGFWWGSAASGPQTEGTFPGDKKGPSIWDYWYEQEPGKFFDRVGPEKTSQVYKRYKEDIQLMKETGHNTFRTSIQWSRLIPAGTGEVNQEAVAFYHDYFDELIANGIEPFVNLYHFDMPMALQEKGGWLSRETVEAYVVFAKTCFELFGTKVKKWFTHNEPIVPIEGGYLYQFHYPNEINMKHAVQAGFHETLASAKAIKEYHALELGGEIGIILNLTPSYPRDEANPEDVKAAQIADAFFNRSFLDPAVKGTFPEELVTIIKELDMIPEHEAEDLVIIQENTIDLLGINYYQPRRIMAKETPIDHTNGPLPDDYFDNYDKPDKKMNPYRGWEIYEKGIYDFGMPIVLNATILIPWVVAPLVVTTFNYWVMAAGLVPAPTGVSVPWTVPVIASGVLATNSWLGGLLQVIDVVLVGMIWYPFLRILDRQQEASIS